MITPFRQGCRRDTDVPTAGLASTATDGASRPWRAKAGVAALLLAGAGLLGLGLAGHEQASSTPPAPPARYAAPQGQFTVPAVPGTAPSALPKSTPTVLDIPAIGVHSRLLHLGLNADGTVQVPPLAADSRAGWYRYSPTPGELGPAVILGHVDSARYGDGVFSKLGALRPSDIVRVTRADGIVAVFRVNRVVEYPKAHFPTSQVYGDVSHAELRLITCGGKFERSQGSYQDNVVVYASLV